MSHAQNKCPYAKKMPVPLPYDHSLIALRPEAKYTSGDKKGFSTITANPAKAGDAKPRV